MDFTQISFFSLTNQFPWNFLRVKYDLKNNWACLLIIFINQSFHGTYYFYLWVWAFQTKVFQGIFVLPNRTPLEFNALWEIKLNFSMFMTKSFKICIKHWILQALCWLKTCRVKFSIKIFSCWCCILELKSRLLKLIKFEHWLYIHHKWLRFTSKINLQICMLNDVSLWG